MDLLGDIGAADQLTSTRAENKILKEKVERLEARCRVLTVENESLKAEVEMYRNEFAATTTTKLTSEGSTTNDSNNDRNDKNYNDKDHFVASGDGIYPKENQVTLSNLHGNANPSCCSLNNDDTILATGGADQNLSLLQWGIALNDDNDNNNTNFIDHAVQISCGAPVIAVDFSRKTRSQFVAAGCMDGSCHIIYYSTNNYGSSKLKAQEVCPGTIKHSKYVKGVAWSTNDNILASASADGTVQLHKVIWNGFDFDDIDTVQLEKIKTFNLNGPVEAICFHKGSLICYARGTPYLSYFDLNKDYEHSKKNLNQGTTGTAGFDEHVSFSVMSIVPHGDYLALATDTSRNIIVEFETCKPIRNLYGHQNDGYSQPKLCWSSNGQYLFGNTQNEPTICVWDIASAEIVQKLQGHVQPIRDLTSSHLTDTMVSTSFDKKTFVWLSPTAVDS